MSLREIVPLKYIVNTLRQYFLLWMGCALGFACIGASYAIVKKESWEAQIPILVRDEATGAAERLGRFSSQTELTAAQETISELARNQDVVEDALVRVGRPEDYRETIWPNADVVANVTDGISVRAPKTSEFGKTEVVYLTARSESPSQAEDLCRAVLASLTEYLREMRKLRADSIIIELTEARDLAQQSLAQAQDRLKQLEISVGTDLAELRGLSESPHSEVLSGRLLGDIQKELQSAQQELFKLHSQRELLSKAEEDPLHLLISEGTVISSQPTIERLKVGLLDAQLDLSQLAGRLTQAHPRMVAARLAIESIQQGLQEEVKNVSRAMGPAIDVARTKVDQLEAKQQTLQKKLESLALIRTDYSRLASEVQQKTQTLGEAEAVLTEAKALRAGVISANLISALGPARSGDKPVGLGDISIATAATASGLMLGLGCVFLIAPTPTGTTLGRRWNDFRYGRRSTDQTSPNQKNTGQTSPSQSPLNAPPLNFSDRRMTANPRSDHFPSNPSRSPEALAPENDLPKPRDPRETAELEAYLRVVANKQDGPS